MVRMGSPVRFRRGLHHKPAAQARCWTGPVASPRAAGRHLPEVCQLDLYALRRAGTCRCDSEASGGKSGRPSSDGVEGSGCGCRAEATKAQVVADYEDAGERHRGAGDHGLQRDLLDQAAGRGWRDVDADGHRPRAMGWGTIARDRGLSNWAGDPRRPRGSRQTVQGGLAIRPAAASAPTTGWPWPAPPPLGPASRPRCFPPLPRPTAALR
jgi:hypothetical protein